MRRLASFDLLLHPTDQVNENSLAFEKRSQKLALLWCKMAICNHFCLMGID